MKKNYYKNNNLGNTLVEVIVSIVIISILFIMIIGVYTSTQRSNANVLKSESIIAEVDNVLTLFTKNPKDFLRNLNDYGYTYDENGDDTVIYYTSLFNKSAEPTLNKFMLRLSNSGNLYKITLDVYTEVDKESVKSERLSFEREVLYE